MNAIFRVVYAACLAAIALFTGCAHTPAVPPTFATCESLDSLALASQIVVGSPPTNSFQPPTMDISAHPFTWGSGTVTSGGHAMIQHGGLAGGSGGEIAVNNILTGISVGFGQALEALRFSFGEYGGNLNLSINNKFVNFDNFSQINGQTIGGVHVNVLHGGHGNDKGQIEFIGHMVDQSQGLGQLSIGGQELWIDDICFNK